MLGELMLASTATTYVAGLLPPWHCKITTAFNCLWRFWLLAAKHPLRKSRDGYFVKLAFRSLFGQLNGLVERYANLGSVAAMQNGIEECPEVGA
jgi:hypothetical protein